MKRHLSIIIAACSLLLVSVTVISPVLAACPDRVTAAMTAVETMCSDTPRNRACYGHALLEAEAQPDIAADEFIFNAPGHQVEVAALRALRLMPMDVAADVWGVALLKLQANLPDNTAEDVTMLLFGDARIENAAPPQTTTAITVSAGQSINVRSAASPNAGVIGTLAANEVVTAVERVADGSWVRVRLPETGVMGWVAAALVSGEIDSLNVVAPFEPHYAPMQAFYFQSGSGDAGCNEAANGLIIQTPEGMGKIRLWMNEVRLQIGSTVYVEAIPGGDMIVRTLEGSALVEAQGVTQNAVAGTEVRISLDADLHPVAPPRVPQPYDLAEAQALPISSLEREIEVAPPLTPTEIATLLETQAETCCATDVPNTNTTTCTNCDPNSGNNAGGNGNGRPDCPGNSCNAPGHNKDKDKGNNG